MIAILFFTILLMHEELVLTRPYYYCTLGIFGLEQAGDNFFRDLDELSEKKSSFNQLLMINIDVVRTI